MLMTQARGHIAQNTFALRSAGRELPNTEVQSRKLQIPESHAACSNAGAAGAGKGPRHNSVQSGADSNDERDGTSPERERGRDIPPETAGLDQAGAERVETELAGMGRGRGGESLEGTTPRRLTSQGQTLPTGSFHVPGSPVYGDSGAAAEMLRTGAHSKIPQILQVFPRKEAAEKFEDAQQTLVPVQQEKEKEKEKEKETGPNDVQLPKHPGEDEAAAKPQTKETVSEADTAQASAKPEFSPTEWTDIKKCSISAKGMDMPVNYGTQNVNPRWESLDREVVRDLMNLLKGDCFVTSLPFFLAVLGKKIVI
ncbi:hypothetical protein DUI87_20669 [Hirundo rustica rustica]|uniref:Uncharacterized protein n=1 Tax=Hirundo rustica rustica TaxID=333673 RepID=A0A3M0JXB2_HIRRU|nr:hypothetical protein DUI87_20669 [Hirundo rustica rustica]